jgi:hypothetical protein
MHTRLILALLSSLLLAGQASAGLITVSTVVVGGYDYGGNYTGEIPVGRGALTWANRSTITLPAGQTTGLGPVVDFWSSNLVSVPATPMQLSVEISDGP